MPRPARTEIRIDEHGDETHESWILVRANRVSASPGRRLFDSEIRHQHYIRVTVSRCSRKARADIEGMVLMAAAHNGLALDMPAMPALESGNPTTTTED